MRRRFSTIKGSKQYLTMEALENGSMKLGSYSDNFIYYRINKGYWTLLSHIQSTTVEKGQIIEFKCLYKTSDYGIYGIGNILATFKCKLSGNCLSLIFGDDFHDKDDISAYHYVFYRLFYRCGVTEVSRDFLPATTLADNCYQDMFYSCANLTIAPELPATALADNCYESMFNGCTSLTTAPELPATTLSNYCYNRMFESCTSLTTAPELPATTLSNYCYILMFDGCSKLNYIKMLATDISATGCLTNWVKNVSSTGTFVKNPAMTSLPTNTSGIPRGWTVVNDGEE